MMVWWTRSGSEPPTTSGLFLARLPTRLDKGEKERQSLKCISLQEVTTFLVWAFLMQLHRKMIDFCGNESHWLMMPISEGSVITAMVVEKEKAKGAAETVGRE